MHAGTCVRSRSSQHHSQTGISEAHTIEVYCVRSPTQVILFFKRCLIFSSEDSRCSIVGALAEQELRSPRMCMGYGRLQRSTTVVCNYKLFVPSFASCAKSILISVTDFRY